MKKPNFHLGLIVLACPVVLAIPPHKRFELPYRSARVSKILKSTLIRVGHAS